MIFRALTWRRRTPTTTAEKTMSAAGVRTASVWSRQLSASSPASSSASGGARVCVRVEEEIMTGVRRVFIGTGTAQRYYAGAPGGSHLKDTWRSCNTLEVVSRSHAHLDCSHFSGFQAKRIEHLKQIQCLSRYLLLTRAQRRHSTVSIECI